MAATAAVSPSEYLQPAASTAQVSTGTPVGSQFTAGTKGHVLECRTAHAGVVQPLLPLSQPALPRQEGGCLQDRLGSHALDLFPALTPTLPELLFLFPVLGFL